MKCNTVEEREKKSPQAEAVQLELPLLFDFEQVGSIAGDKSALQMNYDIFQIFKELRELHVDPTLFDQKVMFEFELKKSFLLNDGAHQYSCLIKESCPSCEQRLRSFIQPGCFCVYYCVNCDHEFNFAEVESLFIEVYGNCTQTHL